MVLARAEASPPVLTTTVEARLPDDWLPPVVLTEAEGAAVSLVEAVWRAEDEAEEFEPVCLTEVELLFAEEEEAPLVVCFALADAALAEVLLEPEVLRTALEELLELEVLRTAPEELPELEVLRTAPEELLEPEVLRTELEEVVEPVPSPVRRTVWPELDEPDELPVTLVAELVVPLLAGGVEIEDDVLLAEVGAVAEEAAGVDVVALAEEAAWVDVEDAEEEVTRF